MKPGNCLQFDIILLTLHPECVFEYSIYKLYNVKRL